MVAFWRSGFLDLRTIYLGFINFLSEPVEWMETALPRFTVHGYLSFARVFEIYI